jgi:hypothetical protein
LTFNQGDTKGLAKLDPGQSPATAINAVNVAANNGSRRELPNFDKCRYFTGGVSKANQTYVAAPVSVRA